MGASGSKSVIGWVLAIGIAIVLAGAGFAVSQWRTLADAALAKAGLPPVAFESQSLSARGIALKGIRIG
ncbi:MAG: hypothetical protein HQL35_14185, partial [Alphaproteobacteria bacterium]|nr:hypothetical protein [Alphaproteobacteria bacterium]